MKSTHNFAVSNVGNDSDLTKRVQFYVPQESSISLFFHISNDNQDDCIVSYTVK